MTDKIAIITGGSRGIGRDTVLRLAARGETCILTYNANRAEADKVVALAQEAGARAVALQLEIGDRSLVWPLRRPGARNARDVGRRAV